LWCTQKAETLGRGAESSQHLSRERPSHVHAPEAHTAQRDAAQGWSSLSKYEITEQIQSFKLGPGLTRRGEEKGKEGLKGPQYHMW